VLLLPSSPSLLSHCGKAFGQRLVALANRVSALESANALVSTLGGGHFLCKHVGQALALAQAQLRISAELGDAALWRRCHIHLIYICIQVAHWAEAAALLRRVRLLGLRSGDSGLLAMAGAARTYLAKTRRLARSGQLPAPAPAPRAPAASVILPQQVVSDDLHRQRLVEFREAIGVP
jgi:hypothetical protein